jgi:hypothetical protein
MRGERLKCDSIGAMRRDVGLSWAALIHGGCLRTAWAGTEIGSCLRFGIRVHGGGRDVGADSAGRGPSDPFRYLPVSTAWILSRNTYCSVTTAGSMFCAARCSSRGLSVKVIQCRCWFASATSTEITAGGNQVVACAINVS